MTGATTDLTAAQFLTLPESNQPIQLLEGKVVMTPAPNLKHQRLVFRLAKLIEQLAPDGEVFVAPVDVRLDDANVVQPDVIWIAPDSRCKSVEDQYWQGAPELVVEVLSPATARLDKSTKFRLYERHGIAEYWTVDPEAEFVEVWCMRDKRFDLSGVFGPGDTFDSVVLGKTIDATHIFED
jgi:Uma2 family endonuclease